MKIKLIALVIIMAGIFVERAAIAENTKESIGNDHAEINLIDVNPDYSSFEAGFGYRISASKSLAEYFYLDAD